MGAQCPSAMSILNISEVVELSAGCNYNPECNMTCLPAVVSDAKYQIMYVHYVARSDPFPPSHGRQSISTYTCVFFFVMFMPPTVLCEWLHLKSKYGSLGLVFAGVAPRQYRRVANAVHNPDRKFRRSPNINSCLFWTFSVLR